MTVPSPLASMSANEVASTRPGEPISGGGQCQKFLNPVLRFGATNGLSLRPRAARCRPSPRRADNAAGCAETRAREMRPIAGVPSGRECPAGFGGHRPGYAPLPLGQARSGPPASGGAERSLEDLALCPARPDVPNSASVLPGTVFHSLAGIGVRRERSLESDRGRMSVPDLAGIRLATTTHRGRIYQCSRSSLF